MATDTTKADGGASERATSDLIPRSTVVRNVWSLLYSTVGLSVAANAAARGLGWAMLWGAVAMGLALLLTSWGLAWRQRLPVFIHGGLIGTAAAVLIFMGMNDIIKAEDAALGREFAANGAQSILEAHGALANGNASAARAAIEPYAEVDDERLHAIEVAARELSEAGGDKTRAARRLAAEVEKKELGPEYEALVSVLDPAVPEQLVQEEKARLENERLTKHFSKWDGSHPAVVAAVKAQMHDPSSFKHIETSAKGKDDTLIVSMTYRGTNSFGGVVTNHVVAVVDTDGNLKSIMAAR